MKIFSTLFLLLCLGKLSAQTFSTSLKTSPSTRSGSQPVGNFIQPTESECGGRNPSFLKVIVYPSCHSANLRTATPPFLEPDGDPLEMVLSIANSGQTFSTTIKFPPQTAMDNTFGEECRWNESNDIVTCGIGTHQVSYQCQKQLNGHCAVNQLSCRRRGDPAGQGALNRAVTCRYMCTFDEKKIKTTSASNIYVKIPGRASCGILGGGDDLSGQIRVTPSAVSSKITSKSARRRRVSVTFNGLNIKKYGSVIDSTTGKGTRSTTTVTFRQGGKHFNFEGDKYLQKTFNANEQCLSIWPNFLGQHNFCGSYYSPLMLFFDKRRPRFSGRSSFPLHNGHSMTYWVERTAPGYFLALDRNRDGRITSAQELFGEGPLYDNGFKKLKSFDKNADFKIDKKDKVFKRLLLWRDKNGDGISQKSELSSLKSHGVRSIGLYYKKNTKSYGRRAEAREMGGFRFFKKGVKKTGAVWDMWFSPIK